MPIAVIIDIGERLKFFIKPVKSSGRPDIVRNLLKIVPHTRISIIIAVVRPVSNRDCFAFFLLSLRNIRAMIKAPIAPKAAASVGVVTPK